MNCRHCIARHRTLGTNNIILGDERGFESTSGRDIVKSHRWPHPKNLAPVSDVIWPNRWRLSIDCSPNTAAPILLAHSAISDLIKYITTTMAVRDSANDSTCTDVAVCTA